MRRVLHNNFIECCTDYVDELFQSGLVSYDRNLENGYQALPWSSPDDPELVKRSVYEWWVVSPWFLQLLRYKKQPVLYSDYGIFWGRCSTEPLFRDSVIEAIYDNLYS